MKQYIYKYTLQIIAYFMPINGISAATMRNRAYCKILYQSILTFCFNTNDERVTWVKQQDIFK